MFVDLGGGTFLGADAAGEVAEMVGGQRHVGVQRLAHGLAVVPGLGDGEHFQVGFDAVGDLQQDQRAVLHGGPAPGIGGGVGSVQRAVDVGGIGAGNSAITSPFTGEVLVKYCGQRRDELAVDEVAVARLEGDDGARGTRLRIDHDDGLSCRCPAETWPGDGPILVSAPEPRNAPWKRCLTHLVVDAADRFEASAIGVTAGSHRPVGGAGARSPT